LQTSWHNAVKLIEAGRVLLDKNFKFKDSFVKPKWILVLSNKIINRSYIYCITTSQNKTYQRTFSDYIETKDPAFGGKNIIIEIERIDLISINLLKMKYMNKELIIKDKISQELMNEILSRIQDSERIEDYKKEWLGF